jgi:hypothetical protein
MRSLATLLTALFVGAATASAAGAAPPPAGKYKFGKYGGFTVNKKRTKVTNFHFSFSVLNGDGADCWSTQLPAGTITAKVTKSMPLKVARRGGYTSYIVGKNTPSTSSGITQIMEPFKLSTGTSVTGPLDMVFTYNKPKSGEADFSIADCMLSGEFNKA